MKQYDSITEEQLPLVIQNRWGVHIKGFNQGAWWRAIGIDGDYVTLMTNTIGNILVIHRNKLLATKTTAKKITINHTKLDRHS